MRTKKKRDLLKQNDLNNVIVLHVYMLHTIFLVYCVGNNNNNIKKTGCLLSQ